MSDQEENKIQGIGRLPVIDPDEMLIAVQNKFPNIKGWFAQFPEVATTLMDADQHKLIGHDEPHTCQLKVLGHGKPCNRDSDFILVNIVLEQDQNNNTTLVNSRVRYYCAPCVYVTMCRAIETISKADNLDKAIEEDISDASARILDQRTEFVESCIARSVQVIENKYTSEGDEIIESTRKKFETGSQT